MIVPGIRTQYREDKPAGVVRCYLASSTADPDRVEIGTINAALCRNCPGLFDKWKDAMAFAMSSIIKETLGVEVSSIHEERLEERN